MGLVTPVERVAKRVRTERGRRGLTQEQLAARARLSRGFLARLETGRHDPALTTLVKLARALRVPVGRLLE
jgi:transcriptional regulator with XRE-family HTH domain